MRLGKQRILNIVMCNEITAYILVHFPPQFFFTMGETGELNNKHTLFGKVVGATIYNMLKLQDGELEDDRPVHPHKIVRTKVLINPFPDIEPRKLIKVRLRF